MSHRVFRISNKHAWTLCCAWRKILVPATLGILLFVASCGKKQATGGQHATILLRDGTTVTGTVTASSSSQITLAGDDNTTHLIPVTQVKSIEYDDNTPPAGTAAQAAAPGNFPAPDQQNSNAQAPTNAYNESRYHPTQAAIQTQTYVVPAGTQVFVRSDETIDSARAVEGQTYAGEITDDVPDANGAVVIPHGSNARIVIRSASRGGRFRGTSDLVLGLQTISVDGQEYLINASNVRETGRQGLGANKRTAEYTGGAAALGAIIGAIAGGGRGAAIGLGAGAGGGALTQVLTKGHSIRVPAETVLTFQLDQPVRIVEAQ
jgi:hypothetical protein